MKTSFELGRGITFVSGLHWQHLPGNPSEARKEMRRLGKSLRYDLAIMRTTGVTQVGMASMSDGFRPGMLSAAAVISKTMEMEEGGCRDFLVAVEIPDGRYLYVAQSNGVILSDGDFIASEEEVRSRMLADISLGKDWEAIVAPMLWGVTDSAERKFEDFLPKKGGKVQYKLNWWRLRAIDPGLASLGGRGKFILGLMVVVLIAGGLVYKTALKPQSFAPAQDQPPPPPPPPWGGMPHASRFASGCTAAFDQAMTDAWSSNWTPQAMACHAGMVQLEWKRENGAWIQHLLSVVPGVQISDDGQRATKSLPASIEANTAGPEPVGEERATVMRLWMRAEGLGLKLAIGAPQLPPPMPGAQEAPPPAWKEMSWSIAQQALPPAVVIAALDGPGFRVNSIKGTFKQGEIFWEMEGKQYVLP